MLLTPRQIEIFFEFYKKEGEILTLSSVAKLHDLSVRTIQNDLSHIKDEAEHHGIEIVSHPGKGCVLNILNFKKANDFANKAQLHFDSTNDFYNQSSRVGYLLSYLINHEEYVKSSDLAEMLFISQSRISSDLKILREILQKYNLEIVSKPSHGIKIEGSEMNMRLCLIKESVVGKPVLNFEDSDPLVKKSEELQEISDILMNVFMKHKYSISEIVLQNLIVHVQVAINRIRIGYPLKFENENTLSAQFSHVEQIAKEIMEEATKAFGIDLYNDEIKYLAINIYGKRELDNEEYITSETNTLIYNSLKRIAEQYQIDLTNELDLRIALALHLMPLITRVKNNMQFTNLSILNLKQTYPLAHNIARDFAFNIFKDYPLLTEDEVGYIAVHFITPVDNKISNIGTNNILIITPFRQSDMFLAKQKILRNTNAINKIDIITESELHLTDISKYSVLLTTEKHISNLYPTMRHINYFLDEDDIKKIDYALRGLNDINYILDKMNANLFYKGEARSKNFVINKILRSIHKHFGDNVTFEKSVLRHEAKTPTSYFGDGIAILHPEEAITNETFISFALLDNPILWDGENKANIVMLVSIEKGNPSAFRLWNIISELISNELFINSYKRINTYEELYSLVKDIYSLLF